MIFAEVIILSIPRFPAAVQAASSYMDVPDLTGKVFIRNDEFFVEYSLYGKIYEHRLFEATLNNKFVAKEEARHFLTETIRQKHLEHFVELN